MPFALCESSAAMLHDTHIRSVHAVAPPLLPLRRRRGPAVLDEASGALIGRRPAAARSMAPRRSLARKENEILTSATVRRFPGTLGSVRRRANRVRAARITVTCCLAIAILSGCASEPVPTLDEVRTLLAAGQVDESVEAMRAMIDAGDRSGETLFLYGRTLSRLGRAGQAVWALDEAMNLEDWVVPAGVALASSCSQWENWDLALETLARVRDERPDDPEEDLGTRLLEARIRLNTRRMNEEALSLLEEIVEDFPESEMALRMKAVASPGGSGRGLRDDPGGRSASERRGGGRGRFGRRGGRRRADGRGGRSRRRRGGGPRGSRSCPGRGRVRRRRGGRGERGGGRRCRGDRCGRRGRVLVQRTDQLQARGRRHRRGGGDRLVLPREVSGVSWRPERSDPALRGARQERSKPRRPEAGL